MSIKTKIKKIPFLSEIHNILYSLKVKRIENQIIRKLKIFESLSESKAKESQNLILTNFLKYSYENTNYYKKLFDDNNINIEEEEDFEKIPFLSKEIINKNLPSLLSEKFSIGELLKRSTGGSTGKPLMFYSNSKAGIADSGHHRYLYSIMGYDKGDLIIGCGGIQIDDSLKAKNIYWIKNKGNVFGDYMFSVLYLSEKNISTYVNKILQLKPNIMRGYPSFYDRLATYINDNSIKIDFNIKGINLTAEMCSITQRRNIERAFSTMIYFEYGHKEISLYFYTQDNNYEYISSPIYGYVEVLDDQGKKTKIGEIGNIVTTGFNNFGMPFIRYKTGDLGKLSYRNGGIIHLEEIHGRTQDFLVDKNKNKIYIISTIYGNKLNAFNNFYRWQIFQEITGKAEIRIIKKPSFTLNDENEILDFFSFFKGIDFFIKYVDSIKKSKIGKYNLLVQKIQL